MTKAIGATEVHMTMAIVVVANYCLFVLPLARLNQGSKLTGNNCCRFPNFPIAFFWGSGWFEKPLETG